MAYTDVSCHQISSGKFRWLLVPQSPFSTKTSHQRGISVIHGTRLLKDLQVNNHKHVMRLSDTERTAVVDRAFEIYSQVRGTKDHILINAMIKLLLYFQSQWKILVIWDDIMTIAAQNNNSSKSLSWPLLTICCIKSRDVDIDKCIEVLQSLKSSKDTLKLHSSLIGKLIDKSHGSLYSLQYIHSLLADGFIQSTDGKNQYIKTGLIAAYGKCGSITSALDVFHTIPKPQVDVVMVAVMMKAYILCGEYQEALRLYDAMELQPDSSCTALAIKACKDGEQWTRGKELCDEQLAKWRDSDSLNSDSSNSDASNCDSSNLSVLNSMIVFYGHSEIAEIEKSLEIYNGIQPEQRDIYTVNAMMSALVTSNRNDDAMKLYHETQSDDFRTKNSPQIVANDVSHVIALNACGHLQDLETGQRIHDMVLDEKRSINLNTALVDMYGKCGDLPSAVAVFEGIPESERNMICINVMMGAYCSNRGNSQCIELFKAVLQNKRLTPTLTSYQIVLRCCTNGTSFYFGRSLHDRLKQNQDGNGWMLREESIQINLINMYAACGMLHFCDEILAEIRDREPIKYETSVSIWNALIHGFGRIGNMERAKSLYDTMRNEVGLEPDDQTFMALMIGCSYSGDDDYAEEIWRRDIRYYSSQCFSAIQSVSKYSFEFDELANIGLLKYIGTAISLLH